MWRNVAKESKNSLSLCIDTGGLVRESTSRADSPVAYRLQTNRHIDYDD